MTPHEERWNEVFGWYKDEPYKWPTTCCVPMVGDLLQHSIFEMRPQEVRSEAEHIKHWIDMHGSMRQAWDMRFRLAGCERSTAPAWNDYRIRFRYVYSGSFRTVLGQTEEFTASRGALVFMSPGREGPKYAWSEHGLMEVEHWGTADWMYTWVAPTPLREW